MTTESILSIQNLVKSYGKLKAVDGVSFAVRRGTCFGLLGPNGAGKSTTIEIIEQVVRADGGTILFEGKPIAGDFLEHLGVQFQQTALPPSLTVRETLQTFSKLYRKSLAIDGLIDLCQLTGFADQRHSRISGGQRQRLMLAVALCNDPSLILLDEPTTGLDPQARRHLWDIVRKIKREGKSIILTTHYMEEAQELCDTVAIMDNGKILIIGPPEELIGNHYQGVVVQLPNHRDWGFLDADAELQRTSRLLAQPEYLDIVSSDLNSTLARLLQLKVDLRDMTLRKSNLEDLFIKLTGKAMRT